MTANYSKTQADKATENLIVSTIVYLLTAVFTINMWQIDTIIGLFVDGFRLLPIVMSVAIGVAVIGNAPLSKMNSLVCVVVSFTLSWFFTCIAMAITNL